MQGVTDANAPAEKPSGPSRLLVRSLGAAVVLLTIALIAVVANESGPSPETNEAARPKAAAVGTAGSSPAPSSTELAPTDVSPNAPCPTTSQGTQCPAGTPVTTPLPVREPLGWGAEQPPGMSATVTGGSSDKPLTLEEKEAFGRDLDHARRVALEIGTVAEAERRGYVKNYEYIEGRGYEYINFRLFNEELDLDKPTMLVFPDTKPDTKVISMAYEVIGTREEGPPRRFPLSMVPWHFHHNLCKVGDDVIGNVETDANGKLIERGAERCEKAGATYMPALDHWMVDLWVIPGWENPWGLVSSKHPDMFKEPQDWFPGAATTATTPASN